VHYLTSFIAFWYDFIIGDDWTVAAGVVIALGLSAIFASIHLVAWVWLPVAVALLLGFSVWRVARDAQ
jgi:predicted histidine transporter YuiF (NhaC family)